MEVDITIDSPIADSGGFSECGPTLLSRGGADNERGVGHKWRDTRTPKSWTMSIVCRGATRTLELKRHPGQPWKNTPAMSCADFHVLLSQMHRSEHFWYLSRKKNRRTKQCRNWSACNLVDTAYEAIDSKLQSARGGTKDSTHYTGW